MFSNPTTTASGFGFGFNPTTTTSTGFNFGNNASSSQSAFSFGTSTGAQPTTGFNFGANTATPASSFGLGSSSFGQSSMFGNIASTSFGSKPATNTTQSGITFGPSTTSTISFGSPAVSTTSTGITFGSPVVTQAAPNTFGLFNVPSTTNVNPITFGTPSTNNVTFGAVTTSGITFGTPVATSSGAISFGATPTNLFGAPSATSLPSTQTSSLFSSKPFGSTANSFQLTSPGTISFGNAPATATPQTATNIGFATAPSANNSFSFNKPPDTSQTGGASSTATAVTTQQGKGLFNFSSTTGTPQTFGVKSSPFGLPSTAVSSITTSSAVSQATVQPTLSQPSLPFAGQTITSSQLTSAQLTPSQLTPSQLTPSQLTPSQLAPSQLAPSPAFFGTTKSAMPASLGAAVTTGTPNINLPLGVQPTAFTTTSTIAPTAGIFSSLTTTTVSSGLFSSAATLAPATTVSSGLFSTPTTLAVTSTPAPTPILAPASGTAITTIATALSQPSGISSTAATTSVTSSITKSSLTFLPTALQQQPLTQTTSVASTSSASVSRGLGGVSLSGTPGTTTVSSASTSALDTVIPNELRQTVKSLKDYINTQKKLSNEIAQMSIKTPLGKITEQIETLQNALVSFNITVTRQRQTVEKMKQTALKTLRHFELAQKTFQYPPSLEEFNEALRMYFFDRICAYEEQAEILEREIEETYQRVLTLPEAVSMSVDDLKHIIEKLHASFIAISGRLSKVHNEIQLLKVRYATIRNKYVNGTEGEQLFSTKDPLQLLSKPTKIDSAKDLGPFDSLSDALFNSLLSMSSKQASNATSLGNVMMTTATALQASTPLLGMSLPSMAIQPFSAASAQTTSASQLQLQKPPFAFKRGKR